MKSILEWRLVEDWQKIVLKAYSIRWVIAAGMFSGLEVALPYLEGRLPIPQGLFAAISGLCSCLAFIYRIKAQKEFQNEQKS